MNFDRHIISRPLLVVALILFSFSAYSQKKSVWIISDISDKNIIKADHTGTVNDPDDISAMAGYLLFSNEFNTRGITVTCTQHNEHKTSPDQDKWAVSYFGKAFKKDYPSLQKKIGGYQKGLCLGSDKRKICKGYIPVYESSIKKTAETYDDEKKYNLSNYKSVLALYNEIKRVDDGNNPVYSVDNPLYILCWGPLTEQAILVNYCIDNNESYLLSRFDFIAHWTNSFFYQGSLKDPTHVANYFHDSKAGAFLKEMAKKRRIKYYECGAIGEMGIVRATQPHLDFYKDFFKSNIGRIFATGKYTKQGRVDDSDGATYYVLMGNYGVTLNDLSPDGTSTPEVEKQNEQKFKGNALKIRKEIQRRCLCVE